MVGGPESADNTTPKLRTPNAVNQCGKSMNLTLKAFLIYRKREDRCTHEHKTEQQVAGVIAGAGKFNSGVAEGQGTGPPK